jgi:FixJ family two-component response regulator
LSSLEPSHIYLANSFAEVRAVANQFAAPVILIDRDWPGTDWRLAVECLAASPNHACVILVSRAVDVYLWQELIRRGGYDVLAKPLQANHAARVVKLALSYWTVSPKHDEATESLRI